MTQYLDKSALLAEIEKLIDKGKYCEEYDCGHRDGNNSALYALKEKIKTLEVKEVYSNEKCKDLSDDGYCLYTAIVAGKVMRCENIKCSRKGKSTERRMI